MKLFDLSLLQTVAYNFLLRIVQCLLIVIFAMLIFVGYFTAADVRCRSGEGLKLRLAD